MGKWQHRTRLLMASANGLSLKMGFLIESSFAWNCARLLWEFEINSIKHPDSPPQNIFVLRFLSVKICSVIQISATMRKSSANQPGFKAPLKQTQKPSLDLNSSGVDENLDPTTAQDEASGALKTQRKHQFTMAEDLALLREVSVAQPFIGTYKEVPTKWNLVIKKLPAWPVDMKSTRAHFEHLLKIFKCGERKSKLSSGIDEELDEKLQLLTSIVELINSTDLDKLKRLEVQEKVQCGQNALIMELLKHVKKAKVTVDYMRPTTMMLLCGLIIAAAIEYSNMHKRIALKILLAIGSSKQRLLFGIMFTTMLFSMWLSNMATTAFMVPIAIAIVEGLTENSGDGQHKGFGGQSDFNPVNAMPLHPIGNGNVDNANDSPKCESDVNPKEELALRRLFLFGVAYSSNIGGTGSILGTAVNYNLIEYLKLDDEGPNAAAVLNFGTWMLLNVPVMLINTFIGWIYLMILFLGAPDWLVFWRKHKEESEESKRNRNNVTAMLRRAYEEMGGITFHEKAVSVIFGIVVLLCFFRRPRFMPGWSDLVRKVIIGDATVFVFGVLLLFMIPKKLSYFKGKHCGNLLDWKYVQGKVPWGILLVNGSAFAMANNAKKTGLSDWVGEMLKGVGALPDEGILLIALGITTIATEFVSNQAVANIMIPILISISEKLNIHPLYLTLPAVTSCSFGFSLPAATNSNTIIFGTGAIRIFDMLKAGAFMNVICVSTLFLLQISWGNVIFGYSDYVPVASD